MLVLSRREKERLIIGDNIVITVVGVSRGTVRLGIEAPKDVHIQREEIRGRERGVVTKPLVSLADH